MLRRARSLLPRPKFHSKYPDAKGVSFKYFGFILQHIVQQWQREQDEENIEHDKRESQGRRWAELPTDITNKPCRIIPIDPIISPLTVEKIRFLERTHLFLIGHLNTHLCQI